MDLNALLYLFLIAAGVYTVAFALWTILFRHVAEREGLLVSIRTSNGMGLAVGFFGTLAANFAWYQNWLEFGVTCFIGFVYWTVLDAGFLEFYQDEVERSRLIRRVFAARGGLAK